MTLPSGNVDEVASNAGDDSVLAFRTLGSRAQGRVVRLGACADEILARHDFPDPVSRALGEALALAAMLGSLLHANGRLILQTKSDGPLNMLVVDYTRPRDDPSKYSATPISDGATVVPSPRGGEGQGEGEQRSPHQASSPLTPTLSPVGRGSRTSVEFTANGGRMRATAGFDAARVAALGHGGRIDQGELIGDGHLAMTIDPGGDAGGDAPRSQGIVELARHTLSAAALTYFTQSEQIPTFVRLAVARHQVRIAGGEPVWHWRAGGLIVQQLPEDVGSGGGVQGDERDDDHLLGDREDDWQRVRVLAATVEDHELLDPTLTPERLLYRLFHEDGVRVSPAVSVRAHCGCSRDRVELLLAGFGADELADMREPDGGVSVTCEYCSTTYGFSAQQVTEMWAEGRGGEEAGE